jgi:rhodanese-related sulfurtransferase
MVNFKGLKSFYMRTLLLILFFVIQTPKVEVLDKPQYKRMVSKGYTIIDVRTSEEFEEGHIAGALNINVKSEEFIAEIENLTKSDTLLVYCRSGRRSLYAAQIMVSFGFIKIYDLEGGFLNWESEYEGEEEL